MSPREVASSWLLTDHWSYDMNTRPNGDRAGKRCTRTAAQTGA